MVGDRAAIMTTSPGVVNRWGGARSHPQGRVDGAGGMCGGLHGVISRVWSVLHFAPPVVVTKDEIDRMVTIADECLTTAEGEFARVRGVDSLPSVHRHRPAGGAARRPRSNRDHRAVRRPYALRAFAAVAAGDRAVSSRGTVFARPHYIRLNG
jgi:hypothetical protein